MIKNLIEQLRQALAMLNRLMLPQSRTNHPADKENDGSKSDIPEEYILPPAGLEKSSLADVAIDVSVPANAIEILSQESLIDNEADEVVNKLLLQIQDLKEKIFQIDMHQLQEKPAEENLEKRNYIRTKEEMTLEDKINAINTVFGNYNPDQLTMLHIICYDISHNQFRKYLSDYLEARGCIRVQKSVFMGELHRREYDTIMTTFNHIKERFDPADTIMIVPLSEFSVKGFRSFGRQTDMSFFTQKERVLLF
jgi:CRISPR-associated protein Cas2